jgi:hypothetical protein
VIAEALERRGRADDVAEEHGGQHALPELFRCQPERVSARELDRFPRLVAEHLDLVPWRNLVAVARGDDELRAVVHGHFDRSRDRIAEVPLLAGARAHDWRHVLRPPPARLQREAADSDLVEQDDLHPSTREGPDLIGSGEALTLQSGHDVLQNAR